MSESKISGDVLDQLMTELDFADAAGQAVDILEAKLEAAKTDYAAAREALDLAGEQYDAACRADALANDRLKTLMRANGVKRTATGFVLAEPVATGPASAEADANPAGPPRAESDGERSEPCNCEHEEHFSVNFALPKAHAYANVPAGASRAVYVGRICDECAATHMASHVLALEGLEDLAATNLAEAEQHLSAAFDGKAELRLGGRAPGLYVDGQGPL